MGKEKADQQDLDLTLKLYEMRRETVTRQSRDALNFKFWPKSYADLKEVSSNFQNELNGPWRQMSSYWEMVYGMARRGIIHADFLEISEDKMVEMMVPVKITGNAVGVREGGKLIIKSPIQISVFLPH